PRSRSETAKHALAPYEFGLWALASFATVDEVKEAVKTIILAPTPAPGVCSAQGAERGVERQVDRGRAGGRHIEGA
ncbi:MAG TPA: hypothetical protein VKD68_05360, partial [Methyloceanibacter sp.]|nr:hypothetical protein [Methyloceanibacter sp.]